MRTPLILILLAFSFLSYAQKQGIRGQVFWLSGNQMPGPGKALSPQQGAIREIHIYNAASMKDNPSPNGFFSSISSVFVTSVVSEKDGTFKVRLEPGRYSVFVKEQNGLFANLFDGEGCINCVIVKPKEFAWITITVDYEAAY